MNRRRFRAWAVLAGSRLSCRIWERNTLADLDRVAHQIIGASRQDKKLANLYTSYTANDPQLLITIDRVEGEGAGRAA